MDQTVIMKPRVLPVYLFTCYWMLLFSSSLFLADFCLFADVFLFNIKWINFPSASSLTVHLTSDTALSIASVSNHSAAVFRLFVLFCECPNTCVGRWNSGSSYILCQRSLNLKCLLQQSKSTHFFFLHYDFWIPFCFKSFQYLVSCSKKSCAPHHRCAADRQEFLRT